MTPLSTKLTTTVKIRKSSWTAVKDVNTKAIFAVMNSTWAVVKIRPEKKNQACKEFEPWSLRHRCSARPTELTSQLGAYYHVGSKKTREVVKRLWIYKPVGLLAQLVEHCTCIAEVMGSNPVQAWIFFRPYFYYCSSNVHNSEDRLQIHKTANIMLCK